jgi:hypothetical protein
MPDFQVPALLTFGSRDDFRSCRRAHEGDPGGYCELHQSAGINSDQMNCSPRRMGGAKGIFQTSLDALRRYTVADVLATFVRFAEGAGSAVTRCDPLRQGA